MTNPIVNYWPNDNCYCDDEPIDERYCYWWWWPIDDVIVGIIDDWWHCINYWWVLLVCSIDDNWQACWAIEWQCQRWLYW